MFAFIPSTGLNDVSQFPNKDTLIRQHLQALIQQIPTYVDSQLALKATVIQPGWIVPTLVNSWVNYSTTNSTVAYMKDTLGFVHLKGVVKSGTSGTVFTLPVGYRPLLPLTVSWTTDIGSGAGNVMNTGVISISNFSVSLLSFDGMVFKAEQ